MKTKPSYEPHLLIKDFVLRPGDEWEPRSPGWSLIQVRSGAGYWLDQQANHELQTGSVILRADSAKGRIRASQLAPILLRFFRVDTDLLTGLITLAEQRSFEAATSKRELSLLILPPDSAVAVKFNDLHARRAESSLSLRLQLLQLFVQVFGSKLEQSEVEPGATTEAKDRLLEFLKQTSASELLNLSFPELVQKMNCTPRHLSRVFHEVVGVSFREKKAKVRLARARELLTTTEFKVVDVALESGYQSPSLFNVMFRKQFGMSPGKWRETQQNNNLQDRRRTVCTVSI